jgi:hypothetical protein
MGALAPAVANNSEGVRWLKWLVNKPIGGTAKKCCFPYFSIAKTYLGKLCFCEKCDH